MNEAQIKKMITEALDVEDSLITDIRPTPGGLTNTSYFAVINGVNYVVRVAGLGTEELINREEEQANLDYATRLGINPPLLYCDTKSGFKITEKIEGAVTVTLEIARTEKVMKQIISIFKCLHTSPIPMGNEFKLFDLMAHYETLVGDVVMRKLAGLKQDISLLQDIYRSLQIEQVPCHIDPIYNNLVVNKDEQLYLIDWEYSGMFDPLWDIATLAFSLDLQGKEHHHFLSEYFERNPTPEELQRILMHTIFQDYLWCLWSYFKDAQGDDIGTGAITRFNRAKENIILYKAYFEEDGGYELLSDQFSRL